MNPYHVLGVSPDATLETLKAAYRRLARENHPDGAEDEATRSVATARMAAINAAWHLVSDPQQRAAFDARLRLESAANMVRARGIRPRSEPVPPAGRVRGARKAQATSPARATGKRNTKAARTASALNAPGVGARSRGAAAKNARPAKPGSQHRLAAAHRLFHEQGRADAAMNLCLGVLRTDVRNVSARELLSEIYVAQGQPHRAFALLEQALMLQPTNAILVRKLNQLARSSGRLNTASAPQPVAPRPVAVPFKGQRPRTPSFQISSRAVSVKHSVLGAIWAYLIGRTGHRK